MGSEFRVRGLVPFAVRPFGSLPFVGHEGMELDRERGISARRVGGGEQVAQLLASVCQQIDVASDA